MLNIAHPRHTIALIGLALALTGAFLFSASHPSIAASASVVPPTWDIVADNFEGATLENWRTVAASDLSLLPGGGYGSSIGLSVRVDTGESYIYQSSIAQAHEGYLTFWFNPNSVDIPDSGTSWMPDKSIRIANVKGSEYWATLVALRMEQSQEQGHHAYLEWRTGDGSHYDYTNGKFPLRDDWQQITLGYRVDQWVAVWVDGALVRQVTGIQHEENWGSTIEVGKTNTTYNITPGGALRYDDVAFQIPRMNDLWVDTVHGDDGHDGSSAATALRTLQKAADLAGPGTTVHVLPGVYRETVQPVWDGSAAEPVHYRAENGPGTVALRGSEPAASLTWTRLSANSIGLPPGVDPSNLYYADLAAWDLDETPRFVVALDDAGAVTARLPLAREPDWSVPTEWKYHELWWAAEGGWGVAGCDPPSDEDSQNCDRAWRSKYQLTDRSDDDDPAGIEAGNLSTLGDLSGATLVALDTLQGHYTYRRAIVDHDVAQGRITVDQACEHDPGSDNPGLGWGTKYYVEGKPNLLDSPGEWWYDAAGERLYLWPLQSGNPATMNIEISRRRSGFDLKNRSYIVLDGLTVELYNQNAIQLFNGYDEKSYGNTLRNVTLRYTNRGVSINQTVYPDSCPTDIIDGFTLENSEIAHADTNALSLNEWWGSRTEADTFTHSGVINTLIRGNEMHHLGFRSDENNAIGIRLQFANQLRFEENHIHHVAQNGMHLSRSIIQSPNSYGFAPEEIKIGEILIKDNVFEHACQLNADCGGLKLWGNPPDQHVFRDLLITGNVFRYNLGWTHVAEQRNRWIGGPSSDVHGMGGFGLYADMASGLHVYRNVAYKNGYANFMLAGTWRDGDILYLNNVSANTLYGFYLGSMTYDTHGNVNTRVLNNIILNNESHGVLLSDADGDLANMTFDHNLYYLNGWRSGAEGGRSGAGDMVIYVKDNPSLYYPTLADIQANTSWEDHGVQGDPRLAGYDPTDHDLHGGTWPDWALTMHSRRAIDRGSETLPASLDALLDLFDVQDPRWSTAWDIGRHELGFGLQAFPPSQRVSAGKAAHYTLNVFPPDMPGPINLSVGETPPALSSALVPRSIPSGFGTVNLTSTLTLTALGTVEPAPGIWYTVPITGSNGVFTFSTQVRLLVGGQQVHLPFMTRE